MEKAPGEDLTVKIGRSDEGDVHPQIPVVRRAVKTEIYAEWDRGPRWILGPAVKAYLGESVAVTNLQGKVRTLFAGLVLSFSNIFCDWAFVANAIAGPLQRLRSEKWYMDSGRREVDSVKLQVWRIFLVVL